MCLVVILADGGISMGKKNISFLIYNMFSWSRMPRKTIFFRKNKLNMNL